MVKTTKPAPKKAAPKPKTNEEARLVHEENIALHQENADLIVERDALAKRVLEMEQELTRRAHVIGDLKGAAAFPKPGYTVSVHDVAAHERISKFEAFLRDGLKTATWNSTLAAELLK